MSFKGFEVLFPTDGAKLFRCCKDGNNGLRMKALLYVLKILLV